MWEERDPLFLALKMKEEDHELRNVGDLCGLEKAKVWTHPWSSRKEHSPANTVPSAHWDPLQNADL